MNKVIVMFFVMMILLMSCKSDNCFVSAGDMVDLKLELNEFSSIEIFDVFTVELKQDTVYYVIVEAGENIIDGILFNVDDTLLTIENNNGCNWIRSFDRPKITVFSPEFKSITLRGECDVISNDTIHSDQLAFKVYAGISSVNLILDCNKLDFSINQGSGEFILKGNSTVWYLYSLGTGFIYGDEMKTQNSYITNKSTGDVFVNVEESLEVKLLAPGDILYKGNPSTINISEQSSSGELISLED